MKKAQLDEVCLHQVEEKQISVRAKEQKEWKLRGRWRNEVG